MRTALAVTLLCLASLAGAQDYTLDVTPDLFVAAPVGEGSDIVVGPSIVALHADGTLEIADGLSCEDAMRKVVALWLETSRASDEAHDRAMEEARRLLGEQQAVIREFQSFLKRDQAAWKEEREAWARVQQQLAEVQSKLEKSRP